MGGCGSPEALIVLQWNLLCPFCPLTRIDIHLGRLGSKELISSFCVAAAVLPIESDGKKLHLIMSRILKPKLSVLWDGFNGLVREIKSNVSVSGYVKDSCRVRDKGVKVHNRSSV